MIERPQITQFSGDAEIGRRVREQGMAQQMAGQYVNDAYVQGLSQTSPRDMEAMQGLAYENAMLKQALAQANTQPNHAPVPIGMDITPQEVDATREQYGQDAGILELMKMREASQVPSKKESGLAAMYNNNEA